MKNYSKKLWWGALSYPARWFYKMNNPFLFLGMSISLVCLLFCYLKLALLFGLITLFTWTYRVITPDRVYIMEGSNKKLFVFLFHSGYRPNVERYNKNRQKALLRTIMFTNKTDSAPVSKITKIRGYSDQFGKIGILLYKTTRTDWHILSAKYYNGLLLGKHLKENIYIEDTTKAQTVVTLIHGDTIVRFDVNKIDSSPSFFYDKSKVSYKPIADNKPRHPDLSASSLLALRNTTKTKLFIYGIDRDGLPMAFQIFVPYVYRINYKNQNNKQIPVDRFDGSFVC